MLVFLLTLVLLVHLDSFRVLRVRSRRSLTLSARGKARLPDLSAPKFPDVPENGYDLVVFGSGPAGEACAVQAAKLGARVAVIEQKAQFGGPTGLSSKAFREATKVLVRAIDTIGGDRRRQIRALWRRRFPAIKSEAEVLQVAETREKLRNNNVDLFIGVGTLEAESFFDNSDAPSFARVCRPSGCVDLPCQHIVLATGSRPVEPKSLRNAAGQEVRIPFQKDRVMVSTSASSIVDIPGSVAIIGGGVVAVEYATVFSQLGVGVSLLCKEENFLPFLESEIRSQLRARMAQQHVLFVSDDVEDISIDEERKTGKAVIALGTTNQQAGRMPRRLFVDLLLYSGGRNGNSHTIGCSNVGIKPGKYGYIEVDENYRTSSEIGNIYAVGDVAGGGLASVAQYQARRVAEYLFKDLRERSGAIKADNEPRFREEERTGNQVEPAEDEDSDVDSLEVDDFFITDSGKDVTTAAMLNGELSEVPPLTLWTIPEIASVGLSNEQAAELYGAEHCVAGYGYFKDLARGRLNGETQGFLKIIAAKSTNDDEHVIVGVHIIGEGATEIIQTGSILVHWKATLGTIARTPFAAVTLTGLYLLAADDAIEKANLKIEKKV